MQYKTYDQLSIDELYAIAELRQQVFIVEQNSVYLDLDGLDQEALHYLVKLDLVESGLVKPDQVEAEQQLIGYGRLRVLPLSKQVKLERIVLQRSYRGTGIGRDLLKTMLADVQQFHSGFDITLASQTYACGFYRRLGFVEFGEPYDDGGIEHISMRFKT